MGRNFAKGSYGGGNGSRRSSVKTPGELDAYSMDVAPLNIFENQVISKRLHNLSKYSDLIQRPQESFVEE